MSGNVYEWVQDCYHASYEEDGSRPEDGSAWTGNCGGSNPVIRGGAFIELPRHLRSARRSQSPPTTRHAILGCRCVRPNP